MLAKIWETKCCQIITFGALWSKAAVRDIGEYFNFLTQVDKIAKLIPVQGPSLFP